MEDATSVNPSGFTMHILRLVIFMVLALVLPMQASISTQTNRVGPYTATSLPATLSVTFPYQSSADLLVLDLGASGTGRSPAVVLTLNSDYTVTGGGYNATNNMQAGNVVVVSGGANSVVAGDYIVILRNTPETQLTYFAAGGVLTGAMIEKALDKGITVSQMLTETSGRSLRFEQGETLDGTLLRSARAGKYLGFDATGAIAYLTGGSGGGGASYTAGTGLTLTSNTFAVSPTQSFTGLTVTNPINGSLAGNAATATALATGRAINGITFDGTAPITVTAAAGTLTGTTLASNVVASSLTSVAAGTLGTMAIQNANAVVITGGSVNGASVTGLSTPSASTDAANKAYVDSISAGIVPRTGCLVATTANITLSGAQTIDGVAVVAGNRVLVKNQTTPKDNGIYDCAAGAWSRSSDSNTAAQLKFGYYYFVSSGTIQAATSWFIQTAPTVLGTDPVVFSQFAASSSYLAGTGLTLTSNTFSLNAAQSGLTLTSSAFNGTIGATTPSTGVFTTTTTAGNSYLGNLVAKSGQLNESATNATASLFLNYDGYGGGTTQFRDVEIMDGKNAQVAKFTGSTKAVALNGALAVVGIATLTDGRIVMPANNTNLDLLGGISGTNSARILLFGSTHATLPGQAFVDGVTTTFRNSDHTTTYATVSTSGIAMGTNALLRTTKGNFNLLVNVKDYGALGDGSTNDTSAIASAATAANSAHGTLYFPAGTYITDTIVITGGAGLVICGDGIGVSVLKRRVLNSGGGVLNVSSSNHVTTRNLTFDGNCNVRTLGGQAVNYDAIQSSFTDNEIINSGEYAFFAGTGATLIYDLNVSRNLVRACYADGINFQYVTRSLIGDNIVDGTDDDCIALGYNGSGVTSFVNVVGNYCRMRADLGTRTGRGILVERASDCLVEGNYIDTIKQWGIYVNGNGSRAYRNSIIGNHITNAATLSGTSIAAFQTTDCRFIDNVLQAQGTGGAMFDIADWQNLTIKGGSITMAANVFCRGIHAEEVTIWAPSWDNLMISGVDIRLTGASTDECIYLSPNASSTMNTGSITDINGFQVKAGDYITVSTDRMGTLWKIGNNVTLNASRTVNPAASAGVYTVFNNQ